MPIYEFHCNKCQKDSEVLVRSSNWKQGHRVLTAARLNSTKNCPCSPPPWAGNRVVNTLPPAMSARAAVVAAVAVAALIRIELIYRSAGHSWPPEQVPLRSEECWHTQKIRRWILHSQR